MGTLTKNFNWTEICSDDLNTVPNQYKQNLKKLANDILQPARDLLGKAINITSGYRSAEHNRAVGGASNSQHIYGNAVDIYVSNMSGLELFDFFVKNFGKKLGGIGLYYNENSKESFIHIDIRPRINNSITSWYQDSNGAYVSPNAKQIEIFKKYNCPWVG